MKAPWLNDGVMTVSFGGTARRVYAGPGRAPWASCALSGRPNDYSSNRDSEFAVVVAVRVHLLRVAGALDLERDDDPPAPQAPAPYGDRGDDHAPRLREAVRDRS